MKTDTEKLLSDLKKRFEKIRDNLSLEEKKKEIKLLENNSAQSDFWLDRQKAETTLKKLGDLKNEFEEIERLEEKITTLEELVASTPEEAAADWKVIDKEISELKEIIEQLELKTFLSGPYDQDDAIVSIHAGQGGTEACDWAAMLQRMYLRFAEDSGWQTEIAEERMGEEAGVKRVTFLVKGPFAYGYLKNEKGTHRLVRLSPFNANNLRQTSFALVEVMPVLEEGKGEVEINPKDLQIDFFRSSGHGGQNVNKVSTAVRIKHLPSNIVVESQSQRHQEQNRKIALQILKGKLWQRKEEEKEKKEKQLRGEHKLAGWGNQIRSYVLHPYKMVKDLRTGWEESEAEAVLDGKLSGFIKAEISDLKN